MEEKTLSKFDRVNAGLQDGNNLLAKATTIEYVEPVTGETESYIVQTVRAEYKVRGTAKVGNFIIVKVLDREGLKRIILPPKVSETIERQSVALTKRSRSNSSKAKMKERMASGWKPTFARITKGLTSDEIVSIARNKGTA